MHLSSDARNDMWWLMVSPDCNMVKLALLLLDNNLWHDDLPLVMRGALALQIARSVDRNDHQRMGHAGGQEVCSRFRIDSRRGYHERVDSDGDAKAGLGKRSEGRKSSVRLAIDRVRSEDRSFRKRQSLGSDSRARGSADYAAFFERLSNHAHTSSGRECQSSWMETRRPRASASQGRSANRYDVGGRERSDSRGRVTSWHRPRARFGDRDLRRKDRHRELRLADLLRARLRRLPRLL